MRVFSSTHPTPPMSRHPDGRPPRVLVVDDVADAADSLAYLLCLHGFDARTARDGPAALRSAGEWTPDAVVTDVRMPGMGGWELARRLRDLLPGPLLVVAVTGCDTPEDARRSAEAGIDLHLLKPVEPGELVALLRQHLSAR